MRASRSHGRDSGVHHDGACVESATSDAAQHHTMSRRIRARYTRSLASRPPLRCLSRPEGCPHTNSLTMHDIKRPCGARAPARVHARRDRDARARHRRQRRHLQRRRRRRCCGRCRSRRRRSSGHAVGVQRRSAAADRVRPAAVVSRRRHRLHRAQHHASNSWPRCARSVSNLTGGGDPERVGAVRVSRKFLDDARRAAGPRPRTSRRQTTPRGRVVLIGHGLWQRRYGGARHRRSRDLGQRRTGDHRRRDARRGSGFHPAVSCRRASGFRRSPKCGGSTC